MSGDWRGEIETVLGGHPRDVAPLAKAQTVMVEQIISALDKHTAAMQAAADMQSNEVQEVSRVAHQETQRVVVGLKEHGAALAEAATASEKYAARLVWATWALVLATVALVVVSLSHR